MSWHLDASGHTPDPGSGDPQPWKAVEEALYAELLGVLAKPEYGTAFASFAGNFVAGQYPEPAPPAPVPLTGEETLQLEQLLARQAATEGSPA
jgi:hypothetical protein